MEARIDERSMRDLMLGWWSGCAQQDTRPNDTNRLFGGEASLMAANQAGVSITNTKRIRPGWRLLLETGLSLVRLASHDLKDFFRIFHDG